MMNRFLASFTVAFVLGTASVLSAPIPDEAMRNAKTIEQFERAEREYSKRQSGDDNFLRRNEARHLAGVDEIGPKLASEYDGPAGFYHGVASGSPLPDAIILWTRWTPESETDVVELELRVAKVNADLAVEDHLDPSKNEKIMRALITVTEEHDWIAKVDMTGLEAGVSYVYGFLGPDGEASRVGLTKTAPAFDADVEQVQYAVFSCAHFSNGYFHAYDIASTLTELDFWIHVGDYIYEYGAYSTYAIDSPERFALTDPVWEIVDLNDYRRRYAQYHRDEGLQNLRARAPQLSIWDDHEFMNDAHGDGNTETSGGENHQEVCPVNRNSTDEEKYAANCDTDEGPIEDRMNAAAKAYFEWMPIRKGPFDSMGFVESDLTQVVEWGNLATFILMDTRISERSATPTGQTTFANFGAAFVETNVSAYEFEPYTSIFAEAHNISMEMINNPDYSIIGSKTEFVQEKLAASKAAGKPWQVFGSGTMMGPAITPNVATLAQFAKTPEAMAAVQQILDFVLPTESAGTFRAAIAMSMTKTPWNLDDYNGFGNERKIILDMFRDSANNGIILGGDLHDSWAWQMYDGGELEGTPVAINLGAPGVSSPGWGTFFIPMFELIKDLLGGDAGIFDLVSEAFEDTNPGLVYGDVGLKGFFVVTSNKEESNIEYYGKPPSEILVDFETARAANGGAITASFSCGSHLVSTAGQPGSLEEVEGCSAKFDSERPAVWSIPLEAASEKPSTVIDDCSAETCSIDASLLEESVPDSQGSGGSILSMFSACVSGIIVAIWFM